MRTGIILTGTVLLGVLMTQTSCEAIFDDDFSAYSVKLAAPADSIVLADTVVQLSWNAIEATADYQVQLAQPEFDSLSVLLKDTVTRNTMLRVTGLERGRQYQWRVRAIGNSSVSPYTEPRTFAIQNTEP
ncbi:hypothetical protein A8C56_02780 [Niabella ginsenosidivorans]|uniref:Fibronectin type-III domain-containing protein n=1 Tax=Niabella ginsenosidivorans TaxID=1176587 RepID=A0A1A9HXA9_9BACT|nr:fibronectin type III domain-containing protein [Niabella ginsenosidivorans]ANH80048.1 hypothetical protein A8C56_02780 [Niabella ginsenosidivorans]